MSPLCSDIENIIKWSPKGIVRGIKLGEKILVCLNLEGKKKILTALY